MPVTTLLFVAQAAHQPQLIYLLVPKMHTPRYQLGACAAAVATAFAVCENRRQRKSSKQPQAPSCFLLVNQENWAWTCFFDNFGPGHFLIGPENL